MSKTEKTSMPPSTMLNPVPVVMVSCAGMHPAKASERPNIITIAWAGTINSEPPMVSIAVRPSRHSHKLISDTKEFVINLVSEDLLRACDYCGVRSGKDEDKFASMSLTQVPAEGLVYAPAIDEAPVSISCKVESCIPLGSHDLFTARIVAVRADKSLFKKSGKLALEDANLLIFSHGEYYRVGEYLGFFGFSVASKDALQRRTKGKKPAAILDEKKDKQTRMVNKSSSGNKKDSPAKRISSSSRNAPKQVKTTDKTPFAKYKRKKRED